MEFRFSEDEERFRQELGEFLNKELTEEICRQNWEDKGLGCEGRAFARKLGAKGWLAANWPKEYGGQGLPHAYEYILVTELARRGAHIPTDIGRLMVGPTILRHGSEELKREFLPRIARGEIEFCLGYTEPEAGSDLAALEMRAVEDSDDYIINGHKLFNTECHYAEYHWLGARTDPAAPRHRGISLFIVDLRSPGITITPMWTMSGERTNAVYYDDVRVPKRMMVGEKNRGFYYIMEAINFERLSVYPVELLCRFLDGAIQYAKETQYKGKPLSQDPVIRQKLAEMAIEIEVVMIEADIEIGLPFAWENHIESWDALYRWGLYNEFVKIYAEHNAFPIIVGGGDIYGWRATSGLLNRCFGVPELNPREAQRGVRISSLRVDMGNPV